NWPDLLLLIVAVGGAQLLISLFKVVFHRARPTFTDPVTTAQGFSFPSGHSMGAMVFFGLMAYFLIRDNEKLSIRVIIGLIFVATVLLVGFSRIYLGVHFPSDVVAGYAAGIAWLALTINNVEIYHL